MAAACAAPSADRAAAVVVEDGRYVMGTILEITAVAPDARRGRAWLEALYAEAERVEGWTSRHREDSDLARLNAAAGRGPRSVAPALAQLLARARTLARETDGAFDVAVGPLVALWERAAARDAPPTLDELAAARSHTGADAFSLSSEGVALAAGARLDLGALAKGTALERMAALAREQGVEHALLNFGQSSLRGLGRAPDGGPWRLLLRHPAGGYAGSIELRGTAVSVSASLGQWSEIGGRRYGHVIDPRSGLPLVRDAQAVVLADDAERAEALSTAWLVLGAEAGAARVAAAGAQGLWLGTDGSRRETPGWRAASRFAETVPAPGGAEGEDPVRSTPPAGTGGDDG